MSLVLHELIHFSFSIGAGFIAWQYYRTTIKGKPRMSHLALYGAALLAGFWVDLDHLFDYVMAFGFNFNLAVFLEGLAFLKNNKNYVPFHGYEFVFILLVMFQYMKKNIKMKAIILAVALGLLSHLMIDTVLNDMKFRGYFFFYRAIHGFEMSASATEEHYLRHLLERERVYGTQTPDGGY